MEPKKYFETYFRIDTGYQWGKGLSREKTDAFYDEIMLAFLHRKWTIQPVGAHCDHICYAVKGKTKLYIHPQELTGPCEERLIPEVEDILSGCASLRHYKTDTYEILLDLEGESLREEYHKQDTKADAALLAAFMPKGKEKWHFIRQTVFELSERFKIRTIQNNMGVRSTGDPADSYLLGRYNHLKGLGLVIEDKKGRARTKN